MQPQLKAQIDIGIMQSKKLSPDNKLKQPNTTIKGTASVMNIGIAAKNIVNIRAYALYRNNLLLIGTASQRQLPTLPLQT